MFPFYKIHATEWNSFHDIPYLMTFFFYHLSAFDDYYFKFWLELEFFLNSFFCVLEFSNTSSRNIYKNCNWIKMTNRFPEVILKKRISDIRVCEGKITSKCLVSCTMARMKVWIAFVRTWRACLKTLAPRRTPIWSLSEEIFSLINKSIRHITFLRSFRWDRGRLSWSFFGVLSETFTQPVCNIVVARRLFPPVSIEIPLFHCTPHMTALSHSLFWYW